MFMTKKKFLCFEFGQPLGKFWLFLIFDSNKSSQLLNLVVQEIQPKIRVIQKAVFETETAKQAIFDNVSVIEQRLMPNVPSDSEVKKIIYKSF